MLLIRVHITINTLNTGISPRTSPTVERLLLAGIDGMLTLGVIEVSQSPWSLPVTLDIKPGTPFRLYNAKLSFEDLKEQLYSAVI